MPEKKSLHTPAVAPATAVPFLGDKKHHRKNGGSEFKPPSPSSKATTVFCLHRLLGYYCLLFENIKLPNYFGNFQYATKEYDLLGDKGTRTRLNQLKSGISENMNYDNSS